MSGAFHAISEWMKTIEEPSAVAQIQRLKVVSMSAKEVALAAECSHSVLCA